MKKFSKIMAVLLVLALAAPCFAKGKVVTKWACTKTIDGKSKTGYLTFYYDNTVEASNSVNDDGDVAVYIGDTRKDGIVILYGGSAGDICEIRGDRLLVEDMVFTKTKK